MLCSAACFLTGSCSSSTTDSPRVWRRKWLPIWPSKSEQLDIQRPFWGRLLSPHSNLTPSARLLLAFKQASPLLFTFGDISAAVEEERTTGICCFRLHEAVNTLSGKYLPQPLAAHCWLFTVWEASVQILFVKLKSGKENVADLSVQLRRPFKTYLSASKTVIYLIHHTWNATVWPWAIRLHLCFDYVEKI